VPVDLEAAWVDHKALDAAPPKESAPAIARQAATSVAIMGSLVPSFPLSRLRAAFSASWNWSNRPAYQFKIRHQFELGGFDVKAGPGIDLDPMGLEWMRTLELSSRTTGIEYRMMLFDDLEVILPGFPGPSPEMLEKMYGTRFDR
jgi:hypothetical protein